MDPITLGTRCGSKLNQTIYLSGASWPRYIMWLSREVASSWKYVFAVVSPHQEQERHGCLCQIDTGFFLPSREMLQPRMGLLSLWMLFSCLHPQRVFWNHIFSMLEMCKFPYTPKFDFFQVSLNWFYAGKDLRCVFWGKILWIHLFSFWDAKK